jgi:hypothetical protein
LKGRLQEPLQKGLRQVKERGMQSLAGTNRLKDRLGQGRGGWQAEGHFKEGEGENYPYPYSS